MKSPVERARFALSFGLVLHLLASPVSAQQWTVAPEQIDFGVIRTSTADRTFVLRVNRFGMAGRPADARSFPLRILAGAPLTVEPASVQISEGGSQTFTVTARMDRIGRWTSTVSVNIGNETMASVKVSGEFVAPPARAMPSAPAAPSAPRPSPPPPRPSPAPPPPPIVVPPPPPPPPAAAQPAPVPVPLPPSDTPERPVYWNVWHEEGSIGPRFRPVTHLKPAGEYMLFVDLATQIYNGAVLNRAASQEMTSIIRKWALETKEPTLTVKVVLLVSDSFEPTDQIVTDLSINLDKVRKADPLGPPVDPPTFADLMMLVDPDFLLGRIKFKLKTRGRNLGMTAVGLSIWTNGRPVDELSIPVCISPSSDPESCGEVPPIVATSLHGLDSFRLADEGGSEPDASLHFLDLGFQQVRGVFHRNNCTDCPFFTWSLKDQTFAEFAAHLSANTTHAFQETTGDPERLRIGSGLYNVLFPSGTTDREKAQVAFEQFVESHKARTANPSARPSIFIRMIGQDADTTLVPFGMMAVLLGQQLEFIGNLFRVEMPLGMQNYELGLAQVDRWAFLLPPESRTDELGTARKQAKPAIDRWLPQATNQFETIDGAFKWMGGNATEAPGTALVVLSHHANDSFYFDANNKLSVDQFRRTFTRPTVAILAGCGTGEPAGRLISDLNDRGVTAVIAAATPVSPRMAADLLTCLSDSLENNRLSTTHTLAHAYYDAVVCLRDTKDHKSRAMTWLLLGNGSVQLRPPRRTP